MKKTHLIGSLSSKEKSRQQGIVSGNNSISKNIRLLLFAITLLFFVENNNANAQTGYIYVHLKNISEENSLNFPFTLTNTSTGVVVSSFNLNDQATADNVALSGNYLFAYDIGLSHGTGGDGQLWAIAGTSFRSPTPPTATTGTIYYRNPNSSNWVSTGISGAKYIDGAYANQCVYINNADNVVFYNNGTNTTIYSGGDARDVTANGGSIAISTSTHLIKLYSNAYTISTAPATGGSWTSLIAAASANVRIDMNLAASKIVYEVVGTNNVSTVTTSGTVTSLGTVGASASNYQDVAYDDNGVIYSSASNGTNDLIFHYNGSSWVSEQQSRDLSTITAGAAGLVYAVNVINGGAVQSIFSRQVDNAGNIYWIDDERVKNSSSLYGNGIIIPVSPGTYKLDRPEIANFDLGGYNLYDPGGSSSTQTDPDDITFVVTVGEVVFGEYIMDQLNSVTTSASCNVQYIQTFDAITSSPIRSQTFGNGTFGSNFSGTSYHYYANNKPVDGYYFLANILNSTDWFSNPGITDHTGNGGYFMLINASYSKDEFFRQRMNNLIVGATYTVSFFAANASAASPIKPNITYGINDTLTHSVVSASTGNFASDNLWHQYTINFTASSQQADLFLVNNAIGGNGNDLAIDDITLTLVTPSAPTVTPTGNCSGNGTIAVSAPTGTAYEYSDNGSSYQTGTAFSSIAPGTYSITTRYVGTTCVSGASSTIVPPMACGNVYDDANGLTDNTVSGTGTNANSNVYANLVNSSTNAVAASSLVNADGTFSLAGVTGTGYKLILTNASQTVGATLTTSTLPSGWASVGEYFGTGAGNDGTADGKLSAGTLSTNINSLNFAIDHLPTSDSKAYPGADVTAFTTAQGNGNPTVAGYQGIPANSSALSSYYAAGGSMTGSDPEDCSSASGCNAASSFYIATVAAGTLLYYNGSSVTAGATISNFNPALLSIYGQLGAPGVSFTYKLVDKAGQMSASAVNYSIFASFTLGLQVTSFTAQPVSQTVRLQWESQAGQGVQDYKIWRSSDGAAWDFIGKVVAESNGQVNQGYNFIDKSPINGRNYYKLEILGASGASVESNIVVTQIITDIAISVYPNPASAQLTLKGIKDVSKITLNNLQGRLVRIVTTDGTASKTINLGGLAPGAYIISFLKKDDSILSRIMFVKVSN